MLQYIPGFAGIINSGGPPSNPYDSSANAWFSAVVAAGAPAVSLTQKGWVDTLIKALKAGSNPWAKLDALWIHGGEASGVGLAASAAQGWIDLKNLRHLAFPVGTETLSWRGWVSSAGTGVLDSGINPTSTSGLNYNTNTASCGTYIGVPATSVPDGHNIFGADGAAEYWIGRFGWASGVFQTYANAGTRHDAAADSSGLISGLWVISRINSTTYSVYRNGAVVGGPFTETATGKPTNTIVFSGRNNGGGSYNPVDTSHYSASFIGGDLSATQVSELTTAILAYLANYNIVPIWNVVEKTQEFDQWTLTSGPNLGVTADVRVAPDGTTTADLIKINASTSGEDIRWNVGLPPAGSTTLSFYLRYNGCRWIMLRNYAPPDYKAWFDVLSGVVGSGTATNGCVPAITAVGSGWWRCSMTGMTSGSVVTIAPCDGDGSTTQTAGSPNSTPFGVHVWGAQLEVSATLHGYNRMP